MNDDLEVRLHKTIHLNNRARGKWDLLSKPRLKIFPYAEKVLNKRIEGQIADMGAGNGYAGAWLAKFRDTHVKAFECTEEAVSDTIPRTKELMEIEESLEPVLGGFGDLVTYTNTFEYVVCFGVFHHAKELFDAVSNVYTALKPGGVVIAHEPYVADNTSNDTFRQLYDTKELFAGMEIRHGDRNDVFHRQCEYLTAFHFANFEILKAIDADHIIESAAFRCKKQLKAMIKRVLRKPADFSMPENFGKYRHQLLNPRGMLFICRKPVTTVSSPPHIWRQLL